MGKADETLQIAGARPFLVGSSRWSIKTAVQRFFTIVVCLLSGVAFPTLAADTDIFTSRAANSGVPNVLFIIDSSASWNASVAGVTKKIMEHSALWDAIMGIIGDSSHPNLYQAI